MIKYGSYALQQDYLNHYALSASGLRALALGKIPDYNKQSSERGTIIDAYLTSATEQDAEEYFCVVDADKFPSDRLISILTDVIFNLGEYVSEDMNVHKNVILQALEDNNFSQNIKDVDKRFDTVVEKAGYWWETTLHSTGKIVVSDKTRSFAEVVSSMVKQKSPLGVFFIEHAGMDKYLQIPVYFRMQNAPNTDCKVLPDHVTINHNKKVITITEIKTIFDYTHENFLTQAKAYNYATQLSFQREGVMAHYGILYTDYAVECQWLVVGTNITNGLRAEVVKCPSFVLDSVKYGYERGKAQITMHNNLDTDADVNQNTSNSVVVSDFVSGWLENLKKFDLLQNKNAETSLNKEVFRSLHELREPLTPQQVIKGLL